METPTEPSTTLKSRILHEAWDVLKILLVALAIVVPVRYFVAQPFIVKGASMEPTFEELNYLVIDELSYYFRAPARGEVVVFRFPLDPSQYFIKRIIGLPGETVIIHDGKVYVEKGENEESSLLPEPYLPD
ncbi:MAG: signal peptidase I, partial [Candidatus Sungbacteria bacterium]|nr:signal peptidase I [Candidatus Sungbacteria bacterium]